MKTIEIDLDHYKALVFELELLAKISVLLISSSELQLPPAQTLSYISALVFTKNPYSSL